MKLYLLLLVVFHPLFVFSQITIAGKVLDKETKQPVPGVVIYTDDKERITMTDDDGHYRIKVNPSESVYIRQLAYHFVTMVSDTLIINPDVYLTRNNINLSEIIISPVQADKLLKKSFQNLIKSFQKKEEVKPYLIHIESNTSIGGEREAYALIEAVRSHESFKKKIYINPYLINYDKIITKNESSFYVEKKPITTEFFIQKFEVNTDLDNYVFELYDNDEERIIIKASPVKPDKKRYRYYLYTINRSDTVLTESLSQSYTDSPELTLRKVKDVFWQISNHYSCIKFAQDETSESYFIKDIQNLVNLQVDSDPSYTVMTKIIGFALNQSDIHQSTIKKKKIEPWDYLLFESDFPETPGFWKEYIK